MAVLAAAAMTGLHTPPVHAKPAPLPAAQPQTVPVVIPLPVWLQTRTARPAAAAATVETLTIAAPAPAVAAPARATRRGRPPLPRAVEAYRAPNGDLAVVIAFLRAQVGKPYQWGTSGPRSFDCSGLVMAAYARIGIRLPHQSGAQRRAGRAVSRGELRPGDLILYSGHVGIAVGNGMMIHAANPRKGVLLAPIYGTPGGYRRLVG